MFHRIAFVLQKILLLISFRVNMLIKRVGIWLSRDSNCFWAIGTREVASVVWNLGQGIGNSKTVNLEAHQFYNQEYSYTPRSFANGILNKLFQIIYGPILLGYFLNYSYGLIYVGSSGYLISDLDDREFEFSYIHSKRIPLVIFLVGSDIRSPRKMRELEEITGEENYGTYQYGFLDPKEFNIIDERQKNRAKIIDKNASIIFQTKFDQASYLKSTTMPFPFILSDKLFSSDLQKFDLLNPIKILHAPTNPFIKGTQLVRAVVKKLKTEGYEFEYEELWHVPHEQVLEKLRSTHIVLNEFYSFIPGFLSLESLASSCVLITRADEKFESELPKGSNAAWVPTAPYEIYDHLKYFLDNPTKMRIQAKKAYEWAGIHAAASITGSILTAKLEKLTSPNNYFKND